ncbi:8872_t:CDS:2, partial [Entrophospora sp. SA101]
IIGAFLKDYNQNNQDHNWFDRTLVVGIFVYESSNLQYVESNKTHDSQA